MKRIGRCFCALHVTRMMVVAVTAVLGCFFTNNRIMAQTTLSSDRVTETEQTGTLNFFALDNITPINGGILKLNSARSAEFILHRPPRLPSGEVPNLNNKVEARLNYELEAEAELIDPLPDNALDSIGDLRPEHLGSGFQWNSAVKQSLLFLSISHAFRFATEPGTRAELKGPFFKDYFKSIRNLRGWKDGDEFLVNYIGHPMGGSVVGFIQVQNDPKGRKQEVGLENKDYWKSRFKAFAWAAAYSTNFELGLFSEASLGNVGLRPTEKSNHPMGYVDFVVTPVLGTGWLVGEDLLDRYLIRWIETRTTKRIVTIIARCFLNPTRTFANFHRGKWVWHRDDRP